MGFVSFKTQDTNEDIYNVYTDKPTKVQILTPDGVYISEATNDGYLRFGGKDYFEIVAEVNGFLHKENNEEFLKEQGMDLFYNPRDETIYPKVVTMDFDGKYEELSDKPIFCTGAQQGFWG